MKKILITFVTMLLPLMVSADDGGTCGENLTWTYVEATKTLTISGSGAMIDASASGYPWHNYRANISKIVLENGVTSIGRSAFAGCTNLSSITIPNSVVSVGSNAFQGIVKIIWLTNTPPSGWKSAKGTINYVSNNQFGSSDNIIVYPFLSSMFEVDGVKYVPVSPSDRTCDAIDYVYDESKTEVNINTSVTYQGINMKVVNVQPFTFYQNPYLKKVNLDISGRLSQYALSNCQNLQIALLGNNITNIDDYAFSGCRKLEGIIIPDEVNAIGQYAFSDCSEMTSVHVGEKTSIIGQYAFLNCSSITSVTIGNSTKTIGEYAFSGCSNLSSLSYGNNLRYIQQYAFSGCSSLSEFLIPGSVHTVEDYAFENCNSLRVVSIIDNDNDINDNDIVIRTFEDTEGHYYSGSKLRTDTIFSVFVSEKDKLSLDYKIEGSDCVIYINTPSGNTRIEKRGSGNYVNTFDKAGLLTITFNSGTTLSNQSCSITNIQQTESEILGLSSNKEYSLFFNCPLDSVYISRKISFALSPFQNNATLRSSVITGEEEKISSKEFFGCTNLQEVQIGNGVTSIGDWAFSGCTSLNHFRFGSKVNTIGKEAFSDCIALTDIVSHTIIPPVCGTQALDDINKWTCKLIVPQGYVPVYQTADQWKDFFFIEEGEAPEIPPTAISLNKSMTKLLIGENETLIAVITPDEATQRELKWKSSDESVAEVDENGVVTAKKEGTATITVQSVHAPMITASCEVTVLSPNIIFADATVKAICVTNWDTNGDGELCETEAAAVTDIGRVFARTDIYSFDELKYFTGLTNIESAFSGCSSLTSITIPNSVTSIGSRAFYKCSGLTSVTIPNSVTSIGKYAFCNCSGLTSITIPNSVMSIGEHAFYGCSRLTSIKIPNSVTSIEESAFSNCDGLSSMVVESGNFKYDSRESCNAIIETESNTLISGCKSTIIPNSVTSIGYGAFFRCNGLTFITIPNSVTNIGDGTFSGCSTLTSITIPNSVTNIGESAFYECSALTSITIPNSVTSIGNSTFAFCSSLTSVTIPNSVTSIGSNAFYECNRLTSITIPDGVTGIEESVFRGCNSLISITIPNSVTSIGNEAFYGCRHLTTVTIPNSVMNIGNEAFSGCIDLTSITIPNSVTSIGFRAFDDCNNLTSVTSLNPIPPTIWSTTFGKYSAKLQVPIGSKTAYQSAEYWKNFANVVEIDPSGVQNITLDKSTNAPKYDLNGRKLREPSKGINILSGKKILIK